MSTPSDTQPDAQLDRAQRPVHPDDDEQTEGLAYGLWLMRSPLFGQHDRAAEWDRLSNGARNVHMAGARFIQACARSLPDERSR